MIQNNLKLQIMYKTLRYNKFKEEKKKIKMSHCPTEAHEMTGFSSPNQRSVFSA